jgi:hypothetical protein
VRLEGLGQFKKSNDLIGNRTRDLQACSRNQLSYRVPLSFAVIQLVLYYPGPHVVLLKPCSGRPLLSSVTHFRSPHLYNRTLLKLGRLSLKIEAVYSYKIFLTIYQIVRCHAPEEPQYGLIRYTLLTKAV